MDNRVLDAVWRIPGRSTRGVVDLDAIAGNVRAVRSTLSGDARLMAVVKADGYGHGALPVAEAALKAGAAELGVATVDEGARLRDGGITARILVLGPVDPEEAPMAAGRGIELAVGDIRSARAIAEAMERQPDAAPLPLHLKVDTGMRRFGALPDEAPAIARFICERPSLKLRGVFTHFAQADEEEVEPTLGQVEQFDAVVRALAEEGISPEIVHAANTAAAIRPVPVVRGMVRLGIGLYGLAPSGSVPLARAMRPALTWVSRVRRVAELQPGDAVSYGGTYRASAPERVALVPVGYADGYRRGFSNLAWMGIGGAACPVRGRVCMDQTVVGLPAGAGAELGDKVVIAGPGGPSVDDLAAWAGTINYEVVSQISPRVPRYYLREGAVIGIADLNGYRAYEQPGGRK